ncbi:ABC transporter ATP-binding protein [Candidatus Bealeia paramacronuclearis]|uniref:ABC transporter ATP-binding protein n=1 Tax=Candidatus Bealeia paramacronuclearis TaxID=1921001 RepID=A0ABZ2C092_9PROT|nr:ABC transporter ATP-binding protein [Candidatus Bealeia paramacronuclearis]
MNPPYNPIIKIENLETKFGRTVIHHHLHMEIFPQEIFGIVGGSGAGKSVLLRTILGLNPIAQGKIEVLGKSIESMEKITQDRLQLSWGVLFQSGALFSSLTVGENIQVPILELLKTPPQIAENMAMIKLKMVGLQESDFYKYPRELSGGMIKRASLARALAADPKILFLDEPTAGLDPIAAASFDQLILTLRKTLGLTIVMVTHDLDSLRILCDRIGVILHKKMVIGTLHELMHNQDPWIQSYFHGERGQIAMAGVKG